MSSIGIGFTLQPEPAFLELTADLAARADYLEIAPETTWRAREDGTLVPNGFFRRFAEMRATGRRFVAHGVGLSMATVARRDAARRRSWMRRVAEDHRTFDFLWWSDHLGASSLAGEAVMLPLPVPPTDAAARAVRRTLRDMQRVVPDVGVENSVFYFALGDSLGEAEHLSRIVRAPRTHLVLDLHNLLTSAQNLGFDAEAYLHRLDGTRVIEIHLSGGSESEPGWLASGRVFRLDAHDGPVPERVFELLAYVLPRCPNLRGVTLERMEGTVLDEDVRGLDEELRRIESLVRRHA